MIENGMWDGNRFEAFVDLEWSDSNTWEIGATDVWWYGMWEDYDLPEEMFLDTCE